jgi:hypothetical protein
VRKPVLIAIVLVALVAASARSAAGGAQGLDLAHGRYGFTGTAAGSTFNVFPFTFSVKAHADGSATGRFSYRQVRDGVELTVAGSLTCAEIAGDRAWVGGVIESSSRANLVGLDMWFQVQDRSRQGPFSPDMSSTIGAGGPGTARAYCDDAPPVMFPFLLDRGDLFVSG